MFRLTTMMFVIILNMLTMMMIMNFQPIHSEKLSLPNAFNVDPLVSNWGPLDVDDDLVNEIIMIDLLMMIIMISVMLMKIMMVIPFSSTSEHWSLIDFEEYLVKNIVDD